MSDRDGARTDVYDIIVIGAGTAGLSAALYGARAGKQVLVLEKKVSGGQIVNSAEVENYPGIKQISGYQFIRELQEQAEKAGAQIVNEMAEQLEKCEESWRIRTGGGEYRARSVILATGVVHRKLGLPGEEALTGSGVSYCAVCDGAFFRDKQVAVVGGGNTALEDARFLSSYCKKVYLIHRRDRFRGESRLVDELLIKSNVEFILESVVTSLQGESCLESILIKNVNTNIIDEQQVSALFVAIGQNPQNEAFAGAVRLDEQGYVEADESCRTTAEGIFAAGDCRTKTVRQLVTAAADGAVAALGACEYL